MKLIKLCIIAALCAQLSGCWFFFIPNTTQNNESARP